MDNSRHRGACWTIRPVGRRRAVRIRATYEPTGSWLTPRLVVGLVAAAASRAARFLLAATGPAGSVEVGAGAAWASDGPGGGRVGPWIGPGVVVDVQGAVLRPGRPATAGRVPRRGRHRGGGRLGPRVDAERDAAELNLAARSRMAIASWCRSAAILRLAAEGGRNEAGGGARADSST